MSLISSLTLTLAPAIAKSILKFWLKNTWAEEIPRDIVDFLKKKTEDVLAQQKGKRQFEAIGEKVAESLLPLFNADQVFFSEERKVELVTTLSATLNKAQLSPESLTERNLEPTALAKHLMAFQPESVQDFSEPEREFFKRAISETSRSIVDIATQLPSFNERTFAEILKRETNLISITTEILEEVRRIREQSQQENPTAAAALFEENYLLAVIRQLDELQLFGVDVSKASKRHKLSVAYVTLSVEQRVLLDTPLPNHFGQKLSEDADTEEDEEDSRIILPVDQVLANSRRLLIRGGAGSGKTTLAQWIAVNSAGRKFTQELADWNNTIPFYIRLRELVDKPLPPPEGFPKLIASAIAAEMPNLWVQDKLRAGQAIVLIDGVDELPETRRDEVRKWLDQLVGFFKDSRFIITSRPSAIEEGWLSDEGFEDAELQPMQMADIVNFIDHWHAAVSEELPEGEEKAELPRLAEDLKSELRRNKQKRELATSPLLCAMLCALHRERKGQIPSNRVRLYEVCIEMLIDRRDSERKVKLQDYPELIYEQKRALLEDLAYWMLKNNWPDVVWSQAEERIGIKLKNMHDLPANTSAEKILDLLVARSGVVREPVPEHIDFTHKTFQEFLAAQAVINEGDIGLLIDNAHKDQWREVVILAAGVTKKESERGSIISQLIERGDKDAKMRYQLHLLAVACLENSISLSPELKAQVGDRLEKLLPPKNMTDAKSLAAAGDIAIPYLGRYTKSKGSIAAACVRALWLIGGEQTLDILQIYAADTRVKVADELTKAWQTFDYNAEYAKKVLWPMWKGKKEVTLTGMPLGDTSVLLNLPNLTTLNLSSCGQLTDLSGLANLPSLTTLYLSFCGQLSDLSPLANLPSLTTLYLSSCTQLSDLSPLANLPSLTTLYLNYCGQLSDLSPLANLPSLTTLNLSSCTQLSDLSPLASLPSLTTLYLSSCTQLSDLSPLANLPNLTTLYLSSCTQLSDLSPLANLPSLTTLYLSSCAQLSDLSPLANLPSLTTLYLGSCTQLSDLSPLANLPSLTTLDLSSCTQLSDLSLLANLPSLTTLYLSSCTQLSDLSLLANLPSLTTLYLSSCTQLSDLNPLANLPSLTTLYLSSCTQLSDLSPLANLPSLTTLSLSSCTQLSDLSPLANLPSLTTLYLSYCTQLSDLSPLANLPSLKSIYAFGVSRADVIPEEMRRRVHI